MDNHGLYTIALWALPVLFAITLHEVAHGWAANYFGDNTAKMLGRLSLNPVRHIDLFGTLILPAILLITGGFLFGWAKPVPINNRNFKSPARDMAIVALAGPLSNFLMALMWASLAKYSAEAAEFLFTNPDVLFNMGLAGIQINVVLMILNLLPLPPLDGSHILSAILPPALAKPFHRIAPYGFFIIIACFALGLLNLILLPPVESLYRFILSQFNLL